jgi:hypothetical protein
VTAGHSCPKLMQAVSVLLAHGAPSCVLIILGCTGTFPTPVGSMLGIRRAWIKETNAEGRTRRS